ncbi:MAG TPA: hypothetical protein VEP90_04165 [Methylomirabilota bacterium]|nr:hypothetical protein [Methylomirabilota bacterium]
MSTYKEEFRKGKKSAKIRSHKQAIITGGLMGGVIGVSIFNDFPFIIKSILFVVLMLILGAVMSSDWMKKKFKSKPDADQMRHSYTVKVDDNFHYMDEEERYEEGVYDTCSRAIQHCKKIVDESLISNYKKGMTAEKLYNHYIAFGEDPFIISDDKNCQFSAWDYAKEQSIEIAK